MGTLIVFLCDNLPLVWHSHPCDNVTQDTHLNVFCWGTYLMEKYFLILLEPERTMGKLRFGSKNHDQWPSVLHKMARNQALKFIDASFGQCENPVKRCFCFPTNEFS